MYACVYVCICICIHTCICMYEIIERFGDATLDEYAYPRVAAPAKCVESYMYTEVLQRSRSKSSLLEETRSKLAIPVELS